MRIVVSVRYAPSGELGPFDAAAYEEALRVPNAEVILLSMGPASASDALLSLTRLGAARAVLLSDPAFAGSDTLATAYILSLAVRRLAPDLVFCGKKTLVGDTGQTGAMLATLWGAPLHSGVIAKEMTETGLSVTTRTGKQADVTAPALLTFERTCTLRLPRLRSRLGELCVWSADDLGADKARCGISGSPTRVFSTTENQTGKRKCTFVSRDEIPNIVKNALQLRRSSPKDLPKSDELLPFVLAIGEAPCAMAGTVSDRIVSLPLSEPDTLIASIRSLDPPAVLFGSDEDSKALAAAVAAKLSLGLCADCTSLDVKDGRLLMYRPALSGSVIAGVESLTRPALATLRTEESGEGEIIVSAGVGVRRELARVRAFAEELGAELCASRRMVDEGEMPYAAQVGLTGRTVAPPVYIAVGISGAVHHVAGMSRAGTVIAINPDKNAPIFEYADFGVLEEF